MRPFSPYIASNLRDILDMPSKKLAKRFKCSATNADRAQKLIVLTIVKNYRWAKGIDASDLEERGKTLAGQMARGAEGELAGVFKSLLHETQRAGQ